MADVFISYARADLEVVRELVRTLENQGFSVFWDRDTAIGEEFELRIEKALNEARCVIVVWSSNSVQSRWVRSEAHDGLDREILVPVRLDESKLPLPFRGLEAACVGEWPDRIKRVELRKVFDAIRLLIDRPILPANDPAPIRDDPTISIRVAERVVHALEEDRASQREVETILTDAAFAMLRGTSRRYVTREFIEKLALTLSCDVAVIRSTGGIMDRVVDHNASVDDETLEQLLSLSAGDGVRLILAAEEDLSAPSVTWCLRIDSTQSAQIALLCRGNTTPPSSRVVGRLSYATQFLTP